MSEPNELEHLQDGVGSEFWRLFSQHVTREWGPAGLTFQQAVKMAATAPDGMVALQKVIATQENMLAVMRWPSERIEFLKRQARGEAFTAPSRRGPGL